MCSRAADLHHWQVLWQAVVQLCMHGVPQLQCWLRRARHHGCTSVSPVQRLQIYAAGIENDIHAWDLRKGSVAMTLSGHTDSVTSMAVSPEGAHLLSNAMVRDSLSRARCSLHELVWLDLRTHGLSHLHEHLSTGSNSAVQRHGTWHSEVLLLQHLLHEPARDILAVSARVNMSASHVDPATNGHASDVTC